MGRIMFLLSLVFTVLFLNVSLAATIDGANLFDNGGFESGLDGWTGCETDAIISTGQAYEGSQALYLEGGNCFYGSTEVSAGQDLTLSCYVRIGIGTGWTGMGLGFVDNNWTTIAQVPPITISGGTYQRYELKATVAANAKYASMWIYSDNAADVDSCSLTVNNTKINEEDPTNLLKNGGFETLPSDSNFPTEWDLGCVGSGRAVDGGRTGKTLSMNGLCVDQIIDSAELSNKEITFSCYVANASGYAALSIFLDGEAVSQVVPLNQYYELVEVTTVASTLTSSYVSIYADGQIFVDDCSLTVNEVVAIGRPSIDVRNNIEGSDSYNVSGPYTFEYAVRNNGDIPLVNVDLSSDVLDCGANIPNLAVDEIRTFSCPSTVVTTSTTGFSHTIRGTAETTDGRVVTDFDISGYKPSIRQSYGVLTKITTDRRIVDAGSDVKFFVSAGVLGNSTGIGSITSNIANCTKVFNPRLGTGEFEVYECIAYNVQESFTATVDVVGVENRPILGMNSDSVQITVR